MNHDHLPHFEDLGHRQHLAHGSCLHLLQDVPAQFFDAIITDPPYSSGGLHKGARGKDPREKYRGSDTEALEPSFEGDQRDQRSWTLWCSWWLEECYRVTRRGGYCALCIDWRQLPSITDALQAAGWTWGGVLAWDKGGGGVRPQLGWLTQRCEFIVFGRKGNTADAADARNIDITLPAYFHERAPNAAGGRWHLTEKPVGLMRHLCTLVRDGGRVLDPFVGSGTTLEACRQLGLAGYGVELEAEYCARIRDRLAQAPLLSLPRKKPSAKTEAEQADLLGSPQAVTNDDQKIA